MPLVSSPAAIAINPVTNKVYAASDIGNNVTIINGTNSVDATVPAGTNPRAIAVNPVTNKIYVTNSGSNSVTVIDGATNGATDVAVGTAPDTIAVNPLTNKVYVLNSGSGNISVIDGQTNTAAIIAAVSSPSCVAVNPVTNKLYAASSSDKKVTVYDGAGFTTDTVTAGAPKKLDINPVTNKVYVANYDSNKVTVIDEKTNAITTVTVGANPTGVAVNPVTNKIYVTSFNDTVTVIDGATNDTTELKVATDSYPYTVRVNPVTNKIYVALWRSGKVLIIDGADNSTTTVTVGTNPCAVIVNPETNKIYILNRGSNNVTVIDGADNNTTTVSTGTNPRGLAVNTLTNKVYIANCDSKYVTVINGSDHTTETLPIGDSPIEVAVNPVTNKVYVSTFDGKLMVLDGATNNISTISGIAFSRGIAVNTGTNKIYVIDYGASSTLKVVDGDTNTIVFTAPTGQGSDSIVFDPLTDKAFITNYNGNSVTVISGQQLQSVEPITTIVPLPSNIASNQMQRFSFNATATGTLPVQQIWYQIDSTQRDWKKAASAGASSSAEIASLVPGTHTIYAMSTNGLEANSTSMSIGSISSYAFTVVERPAIVTNSLADGTVGTAYSSGTSSATMGVKPYTWSATGLSTGLSINSVTGEVFGTPTAHGTYPIQLKVTDGLGMYVSKALNIYINPTGSIPATSSLGGGSIVPTITVKQEADSLIATTACNANTNSEGKAEVAISDSSIKEIVNKAIEEALKSGEGTKTQVELKVTAPSDVRTITANISSAALRTISDSSVTALRITTPIGTVSFDQKSLDTIAKATLQDIKITVEKVDTKTLSDDAKKTIGDRPILRFSVTSGENTISQLGGSTEIAMLYSPQNGEDVDAILTYNINEAGKPEVVTKSSYNPATGMIKFVTNKLSTYAIGYDKVSFMDVAKEAWYSKAVTFIAARGITKGTGEGEYNPEGKLTRSEFLVMLMRTYGLAPDGSPKDNFEDAGSKYYTNYLSAAKRLGITAGVGANRFAPDKEITRQEMATMLYNALRQISELPTGPKGKQLTEYKDAENIATWAKDAMALFAGTGIINGDKGNLTPDGTTTRAELAQVIYTLLSVH